MAQQTREERQEEERAYRERLQQSDEQIRQLVEGEIQAKNEDFGVASFCLELIFHKMAWNLPDQWPTLEDMPYTEGEAAERHLAEAESWLTDMDRYTWGGGLDEVVTFLQKEVVTMRATIAQLHEAGRYDNPLLPIDRQADLAGRRASILINAYETYETHEAEDAARLLNFIRRAPTGSSRGRPPSPEYDAIAERAAAVGVTAAIREAYRARGIEEPLEAYMRRARAAIHRRKQAGESG